ncbi:serine hydrolase domain-containing protein [Undibacterium sp.]|uniref:serine hydrolase domain-containing protein n=1 Tax=Undibacterium sp. TaxID=1914977 RepID=UPI0037529BE4
MLQGLSDRNMPVLFRIATLLCVMLVSLGAHAATVDRFERITPEQAAYSPQKLAELQKFLEQSGSESLLLLHDGKVFFEWGNIRQKRSIHSMRKALLNGLFGHYATRHSLDLQQNLAQLAIDDVPHALSAQEKQATLFDILRSRSGIYLPAAAESAGMQAARPPRGSALPGTQFYYNNWDFNVAGRIFEQLSKQSIFDAFAEHIAKPLGMLDFEHRIAQQAPETTKEMQELDAYYQYEPLNSRFPAYHFRLSAHDLALYGQLFLNRGQWQGQQLISQEWIHESTKPHSITQPEYGLAYGMLWDVLVPEVGEDRPAFFHTGVDVHMLGIYPKHKLVLVHRVNTEQAYSFRERDLISLIRLVHAARLP